MIAHDLVAIEVEEANSHSVRALVIMALLSGLDNLETRNQARSVGDNLRLQRVYAGRFKPEL